MKLLIYQLLASKGRVRYNPHSLESELKKRKSVMPVYTYRCTDCGIEFDRYQSFSDHALIRCPECHKNTLKKVFQPVGIVFKGSGFYATDHHSPSGQVSNKDEKKDAGKLDESASKD